jgi:asparagine synthase (glutamine-hydrolysing)
MYIDFMTYLVDDIMVKVDRTSMAVSLEARAPLLDYRLIEHFWNAPMQSKFARGTSKVVLKDLLKEYLNPKLFDRPKMGFGVPIAFWMRGALREWCEDLVSERALEQHGLFDTVKVRSIFNDFMSGRDSYNGLVWNIVMFQAWYQKVRPRLHV